MVKDPASIEEKSKATFLATRLLNILIKEWSKDRVFNEKQIKGLEISFNYKRPEILDYISIS